MVTRNIRDFSTVGDTIGVPNLVELQRLSYERFLQSEVKPTKRKDQGLEALFREIFPIESYDKKLRLEYLYYELEQSRYSVQECRDLRLTYGYPLKIRCRLHIEGGQDIPEQSIYLGEVPVMIGGGEFIVNGAERVIVNQLHRSPGVDFLIESKEGDRILHGGRIIPERGSWIELSVSKKDILVVRIDQSSRIPATMFLRAMSEEYGSSERIIELFYPTKSISTARLEPLMWAAETVVDTATGEIIVKAGQQIGDRGPLIRDAGIKKVKVIDEVHDALILNTIAEDDCEGHEQALLKIYQRLRPGNPPNVEKAKILFEEKFYDTNRYRLGLVGRFRLNRKFGIEGASASAHDRVPGYAESKEALRKKFGKNGANSDCAKWLERNWQDVRKKFLVKGGERTGGLAFKYLITDKDGIVLSKHELRALEAKVAYAYPGQSQRFPRFNQPGLMPKQKVDEACKKNPKLEELFRECKKLISDSQGWIEVKTLEEDKAIPKKDEESQAIYFFKSLNTGLVNDGYVGLAGEYKNERPGAQGLKGRLAHHFRDPFKAAKPDDCGDSLLKSFAVEELCESSREAGLDPMVLKPSDFLHTMKYIVGLRNNEGEVDDIDHLGNRRLRTIDELAADEIRKGLLKLRRTVQERMSMKEVGPDLRIADLVNSKSVSSSITYFFGRGELSQVVDQTNALSQLTHERRLSALGPGGLNRKRAGFEVRDVHISHYGRICPIETPEGTNIGLIASLGIFSTVDEYGFLLTPYRKVDKGRITDEVAYLRADEEMKATFAPAGVKHDGKGRISEQKVLGRKAGDLAQVSREDVNYVDISPKQIVGVSASLIPFLEHDDANRALMGSNMQRQAVPLLTTEAPLVGTGMEQHVAQNSSMVTRARSAGEVTAVDATKIVIDGTDEYELQKFVGLNERTCLNQKPIAKLGEKVKAGQIIADGGGTAEGVLALGKNLLAAFVPFDGYNFEDAIIVSERLVKDDVFTSIHIDEFTVEVRETKLGREEFTRDIPNVSEKGLRNLDENGIVCEGTRVAGPDDILVGKVSPKSKTELTPEEKLLHAIFGRAGEDVKNDSLTMPSGYEGVVINTKHFKRRGAGGDEERKQVKRELRECEEATRAKQCSVFRQMIDEVQSELDVSIVDPSTRQKVGASEDDDVIYEQIANFDIKWVKPASKRDDVQKVMDRHWPKLSELEEEKKRRQEHIKRGDELPSGVLEMVKVYVATKRTLSVGDKIAGRHGNKGVIARILPEEDMPFLEDGRPLDILLNPLGVPSRMNVGQILETHLGWAAKVLGFDGVTPVFDGASEEAIKSLTEEVNEHVRKRRTELGEGKEIPTADELLVEVPKSLKARLYDGRTGEAFEQAATIGYIYMMKLHHLVDDKIHARATGPYSLITQQPLGGKARTGGQRFGEMEVWALEGYGAAYTLQELLTVKSDDIEGRTKIYESIVKGQNTLEAGTPISFDVLCNEIRGLGLNIQLEKKRLGGTTL